MKKRFFSILLCIAMILGGLASTEVFRADEAMAKGEEYVKVVVNYMDGVSKDTVFTSYTGQLERGTDFHQSIISPVRLGFSPYYNPEDPSSEDVTLATVPAGTLELDLENVTNDIVVNIYYKEIEVPYSVRYYFQNIRDDLYTENVGLFYTGMAKTGSTISDYEVELHAGDITGFSKLYHNPEKVAADGSTVYECYYDRNYYDVEFDTDGGYGVDPEYLRYETPFTVTDPVKPGYTFAGWDLMEDTDGDGKPDSGDGMPDAVPGKIPAENRKYTALWTPADTTVTYVYWKENADDDGYRFWDAKTVSVQSGSVVSGEDDAASNHFDEAAYCVFNQEKTERNVTVHGNGSTVVNVYYDRKEYTLRFYLGKKQYGYYYISTGTENGVYDKVFNQILRSANDANWAAMTKGAKTLTKNGVTYYYLELTAKYGARIADLWPSDGPAVHDQICRSDYNFVSWGTEKDSPYWTNHPSQHNIKGRYETMSSELVKNPEDTLAQELQMYCNANAEAYTYQIYFQNLEDDHYPDTPLEYHIRTTASADQQDAYVFQGFTFAYKTIDENSNTIRFYYTRNRYTVRFYDCSRYIEDMTVHKKYGESLSEYLSVVPDYPSGLEAGAYTFAGWYLTPEGYEGTELTQDVTITENLMLYAKWELVTHTVRFFQTKEDLSLYEQSVAQGRPDSSLILEERNVLHGDILGNVSEPDSAYDHGISYSFTGWFYFLHGDKTICIPDTFEVRHDLNVFADWGSHTVQPYRIQYVLANDPQVKVADDSFGFAYQGSTRTFQAKSGNPDNQLYAPYANGYFPLVASHSITMQYEENSEEAVKNTFTFPYVSADRITYTVKYVDRVSGVLLDQKTVTTSDSVVTERFCPFEGYVPDAFYKRLVLSVTMDGSGGYSPSEDNEIIFYYTPSAKTAFYAVHYMMQNPGTEGGDYRIADSPDYTESSVCTEGVGTIGETVVIVPPEFHGFEVVASPAISVIDGEETSLSLQDGAFSIPITEDGTDLYIFYHRKNYSYTIRYLEYNQPETEVKSAVTKPAQPFGTVVSELPADDIPGYAPISKDAKTLTIDADEEGNVIIFYYIKEQYTIAYKAKGGGSVSLDTETVMGQIPQGSTPQANPGYRFAGWYLDLDCTLPISNQGAVDADTGKLVPERSKLSPAPAVNTFYAKFEQTFGPLTIIRKNASDEGNGNQVFVYRITSKTDPAFVLEVTVPGNGSTTIQLLPQGEYEIEQEDDWSWRYLEGESVHKKTVTVTAGDTPVTAEFTEGATQEKWLNGNSTVKVNGKHERNANE